MKKSPFQYPNSRSPPGEFWNLKESLGRAETLWSENVHMPNIDV